jgi:multicomponent Na+:H+ antiporter subunit E
MAYISLTLVLWGVYLAYTQNLEPSNLVVGLLIGLGVSVLVRPTSRIQPAQLPLAIGALLLYIVRLLIDIVKSGVIVARYILDPKLPITPGIIAIAPQTAHEKIIAVSAHGITITPGEMVVEIGDDGVMYTHCLNVELSSAGAEAGQTARRLLLEKVFR